jgi:hypothetical protein
MAAAATVSGETAARLVGLVGRRAMVGTGVWKDVAGCSRFGRILELTAAGLEGAGGSSDGRGGEGLRAGKEQRRLYGGTREPGTGRGSAGRRQDGQAARAGRGRTAAHAPGRGQVRTMCGSRTGGWSLPCVMSD